jgi:Tfp pilus assembly protein PilO
MSRRVTASAPRRTNRLSDSSATNDYRRHTRLVVLAPVVVVAAASFAFIWRPATQSAVSSERTMTDLSAQLSSAQQRLAVTKQVAATGATPTQTQLAQARAAVPEQLQLGEFLVALGDIMSAAGVTAPSTSPRPTDLAMANEAVIDLSISGAVAQVLDAINKITSMDRVVIIDELSITRTNDQATATLVVRIFSSGSLPPGSSAALPPTDAASISSVDATAVPASG